MKTKVLVQSGEGCKILINPEPVDYEKLTYLVNPDLRAFRGVSPEKLRIVDGVVVCDELASLPPPHEPDYDSVMRSVVELEKGAANTSLALDRINQVVSATLDRHEKRLNMSRLYLGALTCVLLGILLDLLCHNQ